MANLMLLVILMLSSLMISIQNSTADNQAAPEDLKWFQKLVDKKEEVDKLHFYVQDILAGQNQTVYEVARSSITNRSGTAFGQVRVVDDLLTVRPEKDSGELGRVQGLITSSDLERPALTMDLNFVFTSGKYNGSTLSIAGRNQILNATRELPVLGGTGLLRMARGFAITSTYSFNTTTVYGVLEYTVYVAFLSS